MRRLINRTLLVLSSSVILALTSGCDSAGVSDIVFGSLQLAFGIVDAAT